ncbi:hypothetical protein JOF53_007131 [Crossiella equi]|uniref:Uncharacterized protein n=1 Tax=Crossiella equi TaxID=130796 RepID=A0ABS5ANV1_9PSEU|nr:hypothetical protein [Crossiella equi]MBP2478259.1 hypothetical protein [Crossiella equi]
MGVRTWAAVAAASALAATFLTGVGVAAPRGCTPTALPPGGVGGGTALLKPTPGEVLGAWDDVASGRLLHWRDGEQTATPLPPTLNLVWLRGADGTGRAAGSIGIANTDAPLHPVTVKDGVLSYLALPDGVTSVNVKGVNQRGDIAGLAYAQDRLRFLVWAAGSTRPTEALVHADRFTGLGGIADDLSLVVDWDTRDGHTRAAKFLGGKETLLALPRGATDSWATAVGGNWVIGKEGTASSGPRRSVLWSPRGVPQLLPTGFDAVWVNRSGVVGGHLDGQAAVRGADGVVRKLGAGTVLGSVADDGTVLGAAGGKPVTWTCR